jgi:hypothetical protein
MSHPELVLKSHTWVNEHVGSDEMFATTVHLILLAIAASVSACACLELIKRRTGMSNQSHRAASSIRRGLECRLQRPAKQGKPFGLRRPNRSASFKSVDPNATDHLPDWRYSWRESNRTRLAGYKHSRGPLQQMSKFWTPVDVGSASTGTRAQIRQRGW